MLDLSSTFTAHHVPSRHGVHLPHDSCSKNSVVTSALRTMQVVSSMKTTAPEPSIVPASFSASKSIAMSVVVSSGALAPPGMTAFIFRIPPTHPAGELENS